MFNHWLPEGRAKEFFFNFDQIAIYILIAGTYTPLALIALHGTLGWVIFGVEWGFALIGISNQDLAPDQVQSRCEPVLHHCLYCDGEPSLCGDEAGD
jgi:hemolysin III